MVFLRSPFGRHGGRLKRWLLAIVFLWALSVIVLWMLQRSLLFWGASPSGPFGLFSLHRPDVTLRGWVVNPKAKEALVVFGGNEMAVGPLVEMQQCTSRALYLVPYRGYEGQPGEASQEALVDDGVAVVERALTLHQHVAVLGISLGTGVATQVATQTPVDRVLLVAPYDTMTGVVEDHVWFWPATWLLRDPFNSLAALKKISAPIAIVRAINDEVVRPSRTDALLAAIPKDLLQGVLSLPTTHEGLRSEPRICAWIREQTS